MNDNHNNEHDELKHEPVPGYRTAFHVVFAVAVLYLIYTFI